MEKRARHDGEKRGPSSSVDAETATTRLRVHGKWPRWARFVGDVAGVEPAHSALAPAGCPFRNPSVWTGGRAAYIRAPSIELARANASRAEGVMPASYTWLSRVALLLSLCGCVEGATFEDVARAAPALLGTSCDENN